MKNKIEEFIEKGAELEHDRWARWQKYIMLSSFKEIGIRGKNMILEIPKEWWDRWHNLIMTPYSELSEELKEKDREEVRKYLPLFESVIKELVGGAEDISDLKNGDIIVQEMNYKVGYNQKLQEIINKAKEMGLT